MVDDMDYLDSDAESVKQNSGEYDDDDGVIRGHWTPLTYPRITDVIRRLRVGVVAPESFVKVSGLDLEAL